MPAHLCCARNTTPEPTTLFFVSLSLSPFVLRGSRINRCQSHGSTVCGIAVTGAQCNITSTGLGSVCSAARGGSSGRLASIFAAGFGFMRYVVAFPLNLGGNAEKYDPQIAVRSEIRGINWRAIFFC